MENQKKSVLILGNGKSLANHPFNHYKIETIGMNHAYRYWDRIGWYPTYYVTVDHEMSTYFAKDVYRMVKHRKEYGIKKFLLSKLILGQCPKLMKPKHRKSIHFVEDLRRRGSFGFKGDFQATAGSISTRFALFLRFGKIYILGVDANYRPFDIKWARSLIDSDQRLIKTVNPEPTYFFVGYRSRGDYFHIPPRRRWKSRPNHYRTFGLIHRKFNKKQAEPLVVNSNPNSMLKEKKIMPFEALPAEVLPENLSELRLEKLEIHGGREESKKKYKKKKNKKKTLSEFEKTERDQRIIEKFRKNI